MDLIGVKWNQMDSSGVKWSHVDLKVESKRLKRTLNIKFMKFLSKVLFSGSLATHFKGHLFAGAKNRLLLLFSLAGFSICDQIADFIKSLPIISFLVAKLLFSSIWKNQLCNYLKVSFDRHFYRSIFLTLAPDLYYVSR